MANLPNLRPGSVAAPAAIRDRAIEAASGNPRLLDWLDKIVADPALDVDGLIAAIENEADRFRESIFARKLLNTQPAGLQAMLAKVNVVELPVPSMTVYAVHDHPDAASHLHRALQLGVLEEGTDPETSEPRYFASNVLRPLIMPLLTDDEYREACAAAARSLHAIWVTQEPLRTLADSDDVGRAREVGDRAGEAVTRYNVAMIYRAQGELGRVVAELEQVVELDRQVSHPDLQSDTEMLHRLRQELADADPARGRDDVGDR